MGYKSKFKGSTVEQRLRDVRNKQDMLVSGQNIKTINGESVLGSGNLDITKVLYHSLTHQVLLDLRENSLLVPGRFYRIIDYITTVASSQNYARAMNNQFDIIVLALTNDTLSERAWACHHGGDTYFQNSHLEAWQIWYCLDNDTSRFVWATPTSSGGKGVIYRMIDEHNNDCPYDFKNIQFRSAIEPETYTDWYYTFSSVNSEYVLLGDASLTIYCFDNTISHAYNWGNKFYLVSQNLFLSINIGAASVIRGNHIEEDCYSNLIINGYENHLGTGCNYIYIGDGAKCCIGDHCSYIYAADGATYLGYLCEIESFCRYLRVKDTTTDTNNYTSVKIVSGSRGTSSSFPTSGSSGEIETGFPGTTVRAFTANSSFHKEYLQWGANQ